MLNDDIDYFLTLRQRSRMAAGFPKDGLISPVMILGAYDNWGISSIRRCNQQIDRYSALSPLEFECDRCCQAIISNLGGQDGTSRKSKDHAPDTPRSQSQGLAGVHAVLRVKNWSTRKSENAAIKRSIVSAY